MVISTFCCPSSIRHTDSPTNPSFHRHSIRPALSPWVVDLATTTDQLTPEPIGALTNAQVDPSDLNDVANFLIYSGDVSGFNRGSIDNLGSEYRPVLGGASPNFAAFDQANHGSEYEQEYEESGIFFGADCPNVCKLKQPFIIKTIRENLT